MSTHEQFGWSSSHTHGEGFSQSWGTSEGLSSAYSSGEGTGRSESHISGESVVFPTAPDDDYLGPWSWVHFEDALSMYTARIREAARRVALAEFHRLQAAQEHRRFLDNQG
jgi:hypothetical protein